MTSLAQRLGLTRLIVRHDHTWTPAPDSYNTKQSRRFICSCGRWGYSNPPYTRIIAYTHRGKPQVARTS